MMQKKISETFGFPSFFPTNRGGKRDRPMSFTRFWIPVTVTKKSTIFHPSHFFFFFFTSNEHYFGNWERNWSVPQREADFEVQLGKLSSRSTYLGQDDLEIQICKGPHLPPNSRIDEPVILINLPIEKWFAYVSSIAFFPMIAHSSLNFILSKIC